MNKLKTLASVTLVMLISMACLWDKDTIAVERQQFPSVIELLSGKFIRHSPEFHYWRVNDRKQKLLIDSQNVSLIDDLAVSLSKLGKDKEAIELMFQKEAIKPGLYETYANLGTFYLHDGQFAEGIKWIDSAITINPDAHFGRERFQLYLAQSILEGKSNRYYFYVLDKMREAQPDETIKNMSHEDHQAAIKGVLGMMRFGNYDSPYLLKALVSLLSPYDELDYHMPRQLIARTWLKLSYHTDSLMERKRYRKFANRALGMQLSRRGGHELTLEEVEQQFQKELEEGQLYYERIRKNEIKWILSGQDPEQLFEKKYYKNPEVFNRTFSEEGKRRTRPDYKPLPDSSDFSPFEISFRKKATTGRHLDSAIVSYIDESYPTIPDISEKSNPIPNRSVPVWLWFVAGLLLASLGYWFLKGR